MTTTLLGRYNGVDIAVPHNEIFAQNNSGSPPIINITGQPTIGSDQLFDVDTKTGIPKTTSRLFMAHTRLNLAAK